MIKFKGKNIFKEIKNKNTPNHSIVKKSYTIDKSKLISRLESAIATHVEAPENLSLINKTEETLDFINKLENLCNNKKPVFVKLSKLKNLDSSGIAVLLSVVYVFKEKKIKFNGDFPDNKDLRKKLEDSGFFNSIYANKGTKSEYTIGKNNQILTKAKKEVDSPIGLPIQIEVSKTIWGEKRVLKGLQRILVELMHNTNNHAVLDKKGKKHWWLSINHDHINKKVNFIFLDYGLGIFESLKNKPPSDSRWGKLGNYIVNFFNDKRNNNATLLKNLLNGDLHLTVTGQNFRGKGLPGIKEAFDENNVKELTIITNDVKANITLENYEIINTQFNGTFVSWSIDESCKNLAWTIIEK